MATRESPKTVEISLMPGEDLETRPGGKFLKWALSWGKRIVIVTEAIVILAFLSRFFLDATVDDLNEKITQQKNAVLAEADFEKKFLATVERINKAEEVEKQTPLTSVLKAVNTLIPDNVTVSQMVLENDAVSFSGSTDEQSLVLLVGAFRNSSKFSDLVVTRVTKNSSSQAVEFSLTTKFINDKTNLP